MRTFFRRGLRISLILAAGSSSSAVTMDWTPIGDPGNACDPQSQGCFGSVPYSYYIGTYEVTNAQYAEFLNAVAGEFDIWQLYNPKMANSSLEVFGLGGITRSGSSGNFTYTAIAGRENLPVNYVSFFDALRFANWMHNGQPTGAPGSGTTEDGAYTITLDHGIPVSSIVRNPSATFVLPTENEWYKAAYYDSVSASYFDYPAGSDAQTICATPRAAPNRANCGGVVFDLTDVGSYRGSPSPYGTFDQGGNVGEWNETIIGGLARGERGGTSLANANQLASSFRLSPDPWTGEFSTVGFRLASVPEPSTGLLVAFGLLGLAGWRGVRA